MRKFNFSILASVVLVIWLASLAPSQSPPPPTGNASRLRGRNISTTAPNDTEVLTWNAGTSSWTPAAGGGGGVTAGSGIQVSGSTVSVDPTAVPFLNPGGGSNTYPAGIKNIFQASATTAGLRIVATANPSAPVAGDCNFDLTAVLQCWDGASWQKFYTTTTATPTTNGVLISSGTPLAATASTGFTWATATGILNITTAVANSVYTFTVRDLTYSFSDGNGSGLLVASGSANMIVKPNEVKFGSTGYTSWSSNASANAAASDIALCRPSVGILNVNTYNTCDLAHAGELQTRTLIAGGAVPGISGCSADTQLGGNTAGSYTSRTSGTCTVTLTFAATAPNRWVCNSNDLTTPADIQHQSGVATPTTTATITGTTVTGDVVNFDCRAY
jgi:hypothetical protein